MTVLRGLSDPAGVETTTAQEANRLGDGPPSTDCPICGKVRPSLAVLHGDPFCSTRCARAFYGCPLDPATERKPRRELAA